MKRLLTALLLAAAAAAHAQIATGSATPTADGTAFPARIEQNVPGLTQVRNGDASTSRRELGPVMGFIGLSTVYTSPIDGVQSSWAQKDSWTYTGQIYLTEGTTYTFGSYVDDHVTIEIDGAVVLSQGENRFGTGSYP